MSSLIDANRARHPRSHFSSTAEFRHAPQHELIVAIAPRLFAVARAEVSEARLEVARKVPDDGDDGIAAVRAGQRQLVVVELRDGRFAQRFVACEFVCDCFDVW